MRISEHSTGTLHRIDHVSKVLAGNVLGDPLARALHVYTPAGWTVDSALPLLVDMVGYTSSGLGHTNWRAFGENVPERLDRLIANGDMAPVVVAFPDCFTRLGGNQYINSSGTGRYADYLIHEIVPEIERRFGCGGPKKRGAFGKSSGGFGALWHGMKYPDFWSAIACSAGDSAFEAVYLPDIYKALRHLIKHDLSPAEFARQFVGKEGPGNDDINTMMICAMAASYDPDPENPKEIRLPIDLDTARLIPERWDNWLHHDPAIIAAAHTDALQSLKGIWIDCGRADEFNMLFGMRRVSAALKDANIAHTYEEFDAGHFAIDFRQDRFLPWLAKCLS